MLQLLLFAVVGIFSSAASAQCELQTIWSPDGGPDHLFGFSAAGSATMDVIIVGEFGASNFNGAAHIYRYDGASWEYETMLVAADGPGSGGLFAKQVDISADGKTVIISGFRDHQTCNYRSEANFGDVM